LIGMALLVVVGASYLIGRGIVQPIALMEARDCSGAMLDTAGFTASACRAARAPTAAGIVDALVSDFNQRVCHSQEDDLTVVCVRR